MKAYKVFNPDWSCHGFQYEIGKTYIHKGDIALCEKGFHACKKLVDCFSYYAFDPNNKVAEVQLLGNVKGKDGDKLVTDKIKISRKLSWSEVLSLVNSGNRNSGYRNSGDLNSGNRNSGYRNSGDWNSGNGNSGNRNSGDWNSGNWNSGNGHTGFFNDKNPKKHYIFNKLVEEYSFNKFKNSKGFDICESFALIKYSVKNGEKRVKKYLPYKTCWKIFWNNLSLNEKMAIIKMPCFDSAVFYEITGVKTSKEVKNE